MRAFDNLVPNDSCRGAGNAAYARQMADMCFGVNETRLATKRLGGLFTVGRVQTPTLGLVVMRDEAIEHHVTRKFYELLAQGASDAGTLAVVIEDLDDGILQGVYVRLAVCDARVRYP